MSSCLFLGLPTLAQGREARSLTFARRCLENKEMSRFFPRVPNIPQQELRDRDIFQVNFARGAKYQQSVVIHCQNQLNQYFHEQKSERKAQEKEKEERWREWMTGLDERIRRRREGQARQGDLDVGG